MPSLAIIVGRGRHSFGGGVLRQAAAQLLHNNGIVWEEQRGRVVVRGSELAAWLRTQQNKAYMRGLRRMVDVQGLKVALAVGALLAMVTIPRILEKQH